MLKLELGSAFRAVANANIISKHATFECIFRRTVSSQLVCTCMGRTDENPDVVFYREFAEDGQPLGANCWQVAPPDPPKPREFELLIYRATELQHIFAGHAYYLGQITAHDPNAHERINVIEVLPSHA